ncbi:type II toxin-antitoxin system RelE/ParE family toxin [uncultured Arcticibacterium sp.]|uniref:type II toxin-antitoxin system RelE/ParE family toxin n=1 Tax=uncultured Arcticibacterium sp. TaxID=2173042 RepID=UPI0030F7E025
MKIVYKDTFVNRLEKQLKYISIDNPSAARKLKRDLIEKIKGIPPNPLKFRQSIYFDNVLVRDLIFKGYTVVFRINENVIEVFGLVKFQENPTDLK